MSPRLAVGLRFLKVWSIAVELNHHVNFLVSYYVLWMCGIVFNIYLMDRSVVLFLLAWLSEIDPNTAIILGFAYLA